MFCQQLLLLQCIQMPQCGLTPNDRVRNLFFNKVAKTFGLHCLPKCHSGWWGGRAKPSYCQQMPSEKLANLIFKHTNSTLRWTSHLRLNEFSSNAISLLLHPGSQAEFEQLHSLAFLRSPPTYARCHTHEGVPDHIFVCARTLDIEHTGSVYYTALSADWIESRD